MMAFLIDSALRYAAIAIFVFAGAILLLWVFQRSLLYFPPPGKPDPRMAGPMQTVRVETADGLTLEGWYAPPMGEEDEIIILFHGNAGRIDYEAPRMAPYLAAGKGVLLAEYRGYGGNPGRPSEAGFYEDGRAYLDWLAGKQGIGPERIVLYGESLGSGVAVQLASETRYKALILSVPFSSALDVARRQYGFVPFLDRLMRDTYRNDEKIAAIGAPLFIGVAEQDRIVPARFGLRLFELANEPKTLKLYEGAGHNDLPRAGFDRDALAFIKAL